MIAIIKENSVAMPEAEEDFKKFIADERFIHLVVMFTSSEQEVMACAASIERRYLKSNVSQAELFSMRILDWEDIIWFVLSVPAEDKDFVKNTSREYGFKISDGAPAVIGNGAKSFPANNKRVFTLENDESDIQDYKNNSEMYEALLIFKRAISPDKVH